MICSFLSIVVYGGGYPDKQDFPPGEVHYHFSFALQIIGFLLCLASLLTHVRDSYPGLKVWGNLSCQSARSTEVSKRAPSVGSFASSSKPFPREHSRSPAQPRSSKLLSGFALLKLPLALSKFNRGKSQQNTAPTEKATVPIVTATNEEYNPFPRGARETTDSKPPLETLRAPRSDSPYRAAADRSVDKSFTANSVSSAHSSVV